MKAISLWQPWATAMALGLKANETRSWSTDYRGDLAVCSAKRPLDDDGRGILNEIGLHVSSLVFGCALCIVELYSIVPTQRFFEADSGLNLTLQEQMLGDYSVGRFAWLTRNLRVIGTPIPVIGRQGFFNVDIDPRIL